MEGFQYVLQKQEQQKICFGSGCPRDTSKRGMNAFMKYFTLEDNPNVAPNSYDVSRSFKAVTAKPCSHSISKKGYSGIARFEEKVIPKDTGPSPCDYDVSASSKPIYKSKYPFGSISKRQDFIISAVPGPGMYTSTKEEEIKLEHSFGGKMKLKLGVDVKCCSENTTDTCKICNNELFGDYWHLKNKIFLCRVCMSNEYVKETKYKDKELKQFRKIRNCSIMHRHDRTNAKIWLMHPKVIANWTRREAYLSTYLKE